MTKLLFLEGVSGVGKSTMLRDLVTELLARGRTARGYAEFDFTNPIDFYCTAYVPWEEYARLCADHPEQADALRRHAIPAQKAVLVRYCDEDTPLFAEPLLGELRRMEFCYKPAHLVPMADYTAAYRDVWTRFVETLDKKTEVLIFDGSLLHHPHNDMMRNYNASPEQLAAHVNALLSTLGSVEWQVVYLYTDDLGAQLARAHRDRGQKQPTAEAVAFWNARRRNDRFVLERNIPQHRAFNVSNEGWDAARAAILRELQ